MPKWITEVYQRVANPNSCGTAPLNRYSGFNNDGIVLTDRRGTKRVGVPDAEEKAFGMGSDPLAIYRPAGTKTVSAAKAMGNFTGWTFAAVNAIASEVANIQLRLYQVNGDKHEEVSDHALLDLLEGVNDQMTGIEFKYTMMAHLELTGICASVTTAMSTATNLAKGRIGVCEPSAPPSMPSESTPIGCATV
jgi:hypothetical protein